MRDYNIISNRYVEYHDAKEEANLDIARAEAAKEFWKRNDFDPVRGEYFDQDKEKTYKTERIEKAKVHGKDQVKKLPATVQNEAMMYNPINNCIEDESRLNEKDLREKNKKKRYEARGIHEEYTKKRVEDEVKKAQDMKLRKVSHMRVREEVERGFDILSNAALKPGLA